MSPANCQIDIKFSSTQNEKIIYSGLEGDPGLEWACHAVWISKQTQFTQIVWWLGVSQIFLHMWIISQVFKVFRNVRNWFYNRKDAKDNYTDVRL